MKTRHIILALTCALSALSLTSCIFQQVHDNFTRATYPGERPPHVIADNNGQPASNAWQKEDPNALPPAGALLSRIDTASDGIPYGLPCEFAGIITSPYAPHHQLDYTNAKVGDKVWDPYTRKPFYIPRLYTFN